MSKLAASKDEDDPLLQQIGNIGKWQVVTFVVLSMFCIPVAWQTMVVLFHAPSGVDHWCKRPIAFSNWTVEQWRQYSTPYTTDSDGVRHWDQCKIYQLDYTEAPPDPNSLPPRSVNATVPCPKLHRIDGRWEFDHTVYQLTIQEDFDLVCEYAYFLAPIKVSYMFGVFIGVFIGGMVADRFGRRPTVLMLLVAMLVLALVVAMSGSVMVYIVLRFLLALTVIAEYTSIFVFCMEMVGGKWRIIMGMLFQLPFAFGFMSLAGIAYAITNWQHLQLAISVPIVLFFLYYWAVPESPRWLLASGKVERATALIESISDINNREFDCNLELIPPNENRHHVSIVELLRAPILRYRTLNMWFNWFANAFVYYGLLFTYSEVGDNIYLNTLIGGAVEIPAYLISIVICLLLGRKWPISIMMVLAGVFLLATIGVDKGVYHRDWPVLVLAMLTRFCITSSFGIVYVYSAELFPTVLRNSGISSSSTCGRIGSMLAPLVAALNMYYTHTRLLQNVYYAHLPAVLFGVISIAAGMLILLMPETKGCKMPETLQEAENLGGGVGLRTKRRLRNKYPILPSIESSDTPQSDTYLPEKNNASADDYVDVTSVDASMGESNRRVSVE